MAACIAIFDWAVIPFFSFFHMGVGATCNPRTTPRGKWDKKRDVSDVVTLPSNLPPSVRCTIAALEKCILLEGGAVGAVAIIWPFYFC